MTTPVDPADENILVVDDTPANLQLLTTMLKTRGYRVRPVGSGEAALRAVEAWLPHLILLDITMPGLNGYEVCRRLKADARWRDIPVLFISALADAEVKVRAFQAGGIDYVSKPFQFEEVDARVRTQLELRRQQLKLRETCARLEEEERLRDRLTHMIAHDMRSPLLALQGALELLQGDLPQQEGDAQQLMRTARRGVSQLVEMITQMLDVSRMSEGRLQLHAERTDLVALVREVLEATRPLFRDRQAEVAMPESLWIFCDPSLVRRVIDNLLSNAVKSSGTHGHLGLTLEARPDAVWLAVRDDGPGIAPEYHQRVFEKFGQVDAGPNRVGSGLGLTFAKMAVEAHGGRIGLLSAPGEGSTFWIELPLTPAGPVPAAPAVE